MRKGTPDACAMVDGHGVYVETLNLRVVEAWGAGGRNPFAEHDSKAVRRHPHILPQQQVAE